MATPCCHFRNFHPHACVSIVYRTISTITAFTVTSITSISPTTISIASNHIFGVHTQRYSYESGPPLA